MTDYVRANVEVDGDRGFARFHDGEGEVDAGGATFRFSVDGVDGEEPPDDEPDEAVNPRVARATEVPGEGTLRFEATGPVYAAEFILRRDGDDVHAWRNSCPHEPEVRLDTGGGAIVSDDQLVCPKHGARFECGDGFCTAGPCQGDALDEIDIEVRDGDVYLTDVRFGAVRRLRE